MGKYLKLNEMRGLIRKGAFSYESLSYSVAYAASILVFCGQRAIAATKVVGSVAHKKGCQFGIYTVG